MAKPKMTKLAKPTGKTPPMAKAATVNRGTGKTEPKGQPARIKRGKKK
ncbi:MAG TPA: hypothetical protein VGN16_09700 [Acidobacteriaceae bacterium]|jgi:hypothetical protein